LWSRKSKLKSKELNTEGMFKKKIKFILKGLKMGIGVAKFVIKTILV
jgi:hypothetical protein